MLIYLNVTYLLLCPIFLIAEKLNTGHFVPHIILGYVYLLVGVTNLFSAIYSGLVLTNKREIIICGKPFAIQTDSRLDNSIRWISILSIMVMAFLNMIGFGNPSNDSILADFAFGHSLIVLTAILIGRTASFFWFIIVICVLFYTAYRIGFSYRYNYLTATESNRYELAIQKKQKWALSRQETLRAEGLNPPTVSRYFNEWLIFILIAFFTGYFFTGITLDMIKIIPAVTQDIANAIDTVNQQELDREREKNFQEEQKMLLKQESLRAELNFLKSQLNPHFLYNTLNYLYVKSLDYSDDLAGSILKVSDIMRYSLRQDSDFVPLDEEIAYLKDFIDLHQLRNENKLNINFTIEGITKQKLIIPFILISLVENAFKHGKLNEKNYPLVIKISCYIDRIDFYICNRKNDRATINSTQIGLANIQRRLNLTYPSSHSFKIEQNDNLFSCWITIKASS
ncbi:hypothetical protein GCM10028808_43480 [Spirosoma migulaei]